MTATLERPKTADEAVKEARSSKTGRRNKALGKRGEDAAALFLSRRGYEILERNWTCNAGEADIIARDEDTIVFVEVKTRSDVERGFPAEAVNSQKRERYERIALSYLSQCNEGDLNVRFDVISIVVVQPTKAVIRHHINAFAVS